MKINSLLKLSVLILTIGFAVNIQPAHASTINAPTDFLSLNSGLVGWWTMDGKTISGTTVADQSGNGNNGTMVNGPTPTIGKVGQALKFNGTNQYINLGNPAPLQITGAMTISMWINISTSTTNQRFIDKQKLGATDNTEDYVVNIEGFDGAIYFGINSMATQVFSGSPFPLGVWKHVVAVFVPSTSMSLYIDGSLVASNVTSIPASINNTNSTQVNIGAWTKYTDTFTNGKIDDVRIYNRALSATEVQQLYNMGR